MAIQLRAMSQDDVENCFSLTQQLKWPHRRDDWQQALRLGEGLIACLEGEPIGSILLWRWGRDYATIGLVIVSEVAQGRGIGKQLMLAALEKLSGYNVRLHATVAGKPLYEKLGFVAVGNLEQHQCPALEFVRAIAPQADQQLRQALPDDAEQLTALDHQAHGLYRPQLINQLLASAQQVLLLEQAGKINGFAAVRRFGYGWVVGPIIAGKLVDAKLLVSQLLSELIGQFVRIDTETACGLGDWLNSLGIVTVDASAIMVKGAVWQPTAGGMQAFGLMSQALA